MNHATIDLDRRVFTNTSVLGRLLGQLTPEQRTEVEHDMQRSAHPPLVFQYRSRILRRRPLTPTQAALLRSLDRDLRYLATLPTSADRSRAALVTTIALLEAMHSLTEPVTPIDKLLWKWRANPYLTANQVELDGLRAVFMPRLDGAADSPPQLWTAMPATAVQEM